MMYADIDEKGWILHTINDYPLMKFFEPKRENKQLKNLIRRIDKKIKSQNRRPGKVERKRRLRRPAGPVAIAERPEGSLEDFLNSELLGMAVEEKMVPEWTNRSRTHYRMVKSGELTQDTIDRIREKTSRFLDVSPERVFVNVRFRPSDIRTPYLSIYIADR